MYTPRKAPLLLLLLPIWTMFTSYQGCLASRSSSLYSRQLPSSWLPNLPQRLTGSGWRGIPDASTCAVQSATKFRGSQGFLYHSVSGLCSPLLWLEGPLSPNALPVQSGEGDLYLVTGWCTGDKFQLLELGTGELVCLRLIQRLATYTEATKYCVSVGSYLTPVKTFAKLKIVRDHATSTNAWVGIDSLSGPLSWSSDGQQLTKEQTDAVFYPGEPNSKNGTENCGEFSVNFQMLNDISCNNRCNFICERSLPALGVE